MPKEISYMLVINLHETDYLESTLDALAKEYLRDIVVYDAEGIASRHGADLPNFNFFEAGITSLLSTKNNQNAVILAVVATDHKESLSKRLQALRLDDRWAASYWFVPIEGYFYHKGSDNL